MNTQPFLMPRRVLAVGAHPDDLEILAGGTLVKYAQAGVPVSMAVATDGSAGHATIPNHELSLLRRKEAERSAAVIGADFHWLGFVDEMLPDDMQTRWAFVELIRSVQPEVILTHHPHDYHPDHRTTSKLVFDASFVASLPGIRTAQPATPTVPELYYFDTINGAGFQPEEYVDTTPAFDTKWKMLQNHVTQLKVGQDSGGVDYLDMIEVLSRFRGLQCGVRYAEGFISEKSFPYHRPLRSLP